jgi:hypothetical protein
VKRLNARASAAGTSATAASISSAEIANPAGVTLSRSNRAV